MFPDKGRADGAGTALGNAVLVGDDLGAAGVQWNIACSAGVDSQAAVLQWTTTISTAVRRCCTSD